MAAETDARCQGDVRKLALFFEKLAASSPLDTRKSSEIINRKGSGGSAGSGTYTGNTPVVSMGQNGFGGPVARGDASVDKRQCVPCNECSKLHPPYSTCPYSVGPCDICDKVHRIACCPYLNHLPRGATFNSGYRVVCVCGYLFDEVKWACPLCGRSRAVLQAKRCSICNVWKQHSAYECPEDKDLAARYKLVREKMLSEVSIPIAYSGNYVPSNPSSRFSEDMKEKGWKVIPM